jgi:hypothetical protein
VTLGVVPALRNLLHHPSHQHAHHRVAVDQVLERSHRRSQRSRPAAVDPLHVTSQPTLQLLLARRKPTSTTPHIVSTATHPLTVEKRPNPPLADPTTALPHDPAESHSPPHVTRGGGPTTGQGSACGARPLVSTPTGGLHAGQVDREPPRADLCARALFKSTDTCQSGCPAASASVSSTVSTSSQMPSSAKRACRFPIICHAPKVRRQVPPWRPCPGTVLSHPDRPIRAALLVGTVLA